ncbi:MAG TPA: flagellar hook-basal body complex protein FliE [Terracidiphilus sp.]|jgi:flagellar hook-basal body complex protein FliE
MIPALDFVTNTLSSGPATRNSLSSMQSAPSATKEAEPFGGLLKDAIGQVNQLEQQAHAAVTGLMTGTGVDVHQALIASEKASMAFEMVLAVRNKAIQSYQSVMSMQF